MITYDVFQPTSNLTWPSLPAKAQILKPDGTFEDVTLGSPADFIVNHGEAVAIKFIRPDPVTEKVNEVAKALGLPNSGLGGKIIRGVVEYMLKDEQPKVDVNLPAKSRADEHDWLMTKLDKMGYNKTRDRVAIANWYFEPATHKTAPLDRNSILTVKKLGDYGRVVVLPSGHTIAYMIAQKIWWFMNDQNLPHNFSRTTVGEYINGYSGISHERRSLDINQYRVKVGCQTVDRDVIAEFAQRQGWSKTPPYGAY